MRRAAAVVFVASFCTLVIELVAGRVLAPYVGVSLYTWTSIIGVVLAGISAGAYAGGRLAERRPSASNGVAWRVLTIQLDRADALCGHSHPCADRHSEDQDSTDQPSSEPVHRHPPSHVALRPALRS